MGYIAGPVFCRKYEEIFTARPMQVRQIEAMPFELQAGVDHVDGLLDGSDQQVLVRLVAQVAGVDQGGVPGMFGRKFNLGIKSSQQNKNKINVNLVGFWEIRLSKNLKSSCWKKN